MSEIGIVTAEEFILILSELPTADKFVAEKARVRQTILTKPQGSLGQLEELAIWLASWQGRDRPTLDKATCVVFAGNHGVTAKGVSAFPPEVTAQMVANFEAGGAAINQLCRASGANLKVIALDLDNPTEDFSERPALSAEACGQALWAGMNAVPKEADILLLGEMGIGNSTSAAALSTACFGGRAIDWTGPGTGLNESQMSHKAQIIEQALKCHEGKLTSAFEILRRLGGRELAALVGAVLAARQRNIPVILDGFICTAAAAVLTVDCDTALDHCQVAHLSVELGHKRLADILGKTPILDLGMRLGEASGAAVALLILRAAVDVHNGMATFDQAGVSNRE